MQRTKLVNLIILLTALWLTVLASACSSEPVTPTIPVASPVPASSGTEEATAPPAGKSSQVQAVEEIAEMVAQRTPVPTATPGPVEQFVEEMAKESGLAGQSFLGLSTKDWIDLGLSILFVVLGILLGFYLLLGLVRWAVGRTKTQFDDRFLDTIEPELKWLVVIILTRVAVLRLDLWGDEVRVLLEDLFFVLSTVILTIIAFRLVTFASKWYRGYRVPKENRKAMGPIVEMAKRVGYLSVTVIALSISVSHFGINVTWPSAMILFAVVVIAVAARAAINDAVSGFLILMDQPFRIGDDIYLKELETWGRVMSVGIRITRIRPLDNREVTIPNSLIGES